MAVSECMRAFSPSCQVYHRSGSSMHRGLPAPRITRISFPLQRASRMFHPRLDMSATNLPVSCPSVHVPFGALAVGRWHSARWRLAPGTRHSALGARRSGGRAMRDGRCDTPATDVGNTFTQSTILGGTGLVSRTVDYTLLGGHLHPRYTDTAEACSSDQRLATEQAKRNAALIVARSVGWSTAAF